MRILATREYTCRKRGKAGILQVFLIFLSIINIIYICVVVDQYSFILEWPFFAEKKMSFADLSRPHREARSYV